MKRMSKDLEMGGLIYKHFHGDTTSDEEELLKAWRLNSRNAELFSRLQCAENLYEGVAELANVNVGKPFDKITGKIRRKRRVRVVKFVSGVAAVVLLGVSGIFFLWDGFVAGNDAVLAWEPVAREATMAKLETAEGNVIYLKDSMKQLPLSCLPMTRSENAGTCLEESVPGREVEYNVLTTSDRGFIKVTLYDGSRVWLNAESELRYANSFVDSRRVVFLKGEAFFEVAKDSVHPFIVNTFVSRIDVLGTSFNVSAREKSCVTTLVEGVVKMRHGVRDSVELRPGQQASVSGGGGIRVREVDSRYYTGWVDNLFAFRETSLREIMDELGKWYGCRVRFDDPGVEEQRYTAIVERFPEVDRVLHLLTKTGDFRYVRVDDLIIVKKK